VFPEVGVSKDPKAAYGRNDVGRIAHPALFMTSQAGTSKRKHSVCHVESHLRCSGNTLRDLVPAHVNDPGNPSCNGERAGDAS